MFFFFFVFCVDTPPPRFHHQALNATGRPILYACSWPDYQLGHVNVSWDLIKKVRPLSERNILGRTSS